MSPRLVGAVLAVVAAILLVASIASSALWAGHPRVDGREQIKKTVYIGLVGGQGCNTGGDGSCEDLALSSAYETTALIQLGTSGLFGVLVLLLAATSFARAQSRKTINKLVIVAALLCVVVLGVMFVVGPEIRSSHKVDVPIGYSMFLFGGALLAAVLAAVLAPKDDRVTLRPSRQALPVPMAPMASPIPVGPLTPPAHSQPPVDFAAMLQPEPPPVAPMITPPPPMPMAPPPPMPMAPPPSPGGMLPGPAGPLGSPLFQNAPPPQIRPRIPTPPPMSVAQVTGGEAPRPPKTPSLPPPVRGKAASLPPPTKLPAPGFTKKGPTTLPPPVAPSLPGLPPPPPAIPSGMLPFRADTDPGDLAATRELTHEPDLMVGSPLSAAPKPPPPEESTDINAKPIEATESEAQPIEAEPEVEPIEVEPDPVVPDPAEPDENAQTTAREKMDPDEFDVATQARPPAATPAPAPSPAASSPKIPVSTAPESLPPPKDEKAAVGGPVPACPQCEAPMNWVEEHLRFYCKSCRMYF